MRIHFGPLCIFQYFKISLERICYFHLAFVSNGWVFFICLSWNQFLVNWFLICISWIHYDSINSNNHSKINFRIHSNIYNILSEQRINSNILELSISDINWRNNKRSHCIRAESLDSLAQRRNTKNYNLNSSFIDNCYFGLSHRKHNTMFEYLNWSRDKKREIFKQIGKKTIVERIKRVSDSWRKFGKWWIASHVIRDC